MMNKLPSSNSLGNLSLLDENSMAHTNIFVANKNNGANAGSDTTLERLQTLRQLHYQQIIDLELLLETTPKDAQYSQTLIQLMQKEENFIRSMTGPVIMLPKDLTDKIDSLLGQETKSFYAKVTHQNIKRWIALENKLSKEREYLKKELKVSGNVNENHGNKYDDTNSSCYTIHPSYTQNLRAYKQLNPLIHQSYQQQLLTPEALLQRERENIMDYNKSWYIHESLHLNEAFKLQHAKIEADWSKHEKKLQYEYEQKLEELGCSLLTPNSFSPNASRDNSVPSSPVGSPEQWHSPEKQKTLVHTAPILSPTTNKRKSNSTILKGNCDGMTSPCQTITNPKHKNAELLKLENNYNQSVFQLQVQKLAAVRWMSHQKLRLFAQAEEVRLERQAIYNVYAKHNEAFDYLHLFLGSLSRSEISKEE